MNQLQTLVLTVLVICHSWTIKTAFVPGIMDLLNMDVTTLSPTIRTWPPTKPGQVNPARCAQTKNGCCKDGHTPSPEPNGKGCANELCYDEYPGDCYIKKITGQLDCTPGKYDHTYCPYRCGACKLPAPPITRCQSLRPAFGCCWDGTIPLDRNGKGCRACEDLFPHTCQQFVHVAGGCDSGSYFIRNFMMTKCPRTCGFCAYGL